MWYAIIGEDGPKSLDKRVSSRPAHLDRLRALQAEGQLLLAGPFPAIDCEDPGPTGFTGSLIVAEFDSLQDAQKWADTDPYVTNGVFKRVTVKPFNRVMPE
ncbi:MAG: YciI family protein [Burkholderiales bacterium]